MTKERPILFSGAMVRAILDGRKTQTRRVCKSQPYSNGFHFDGHDILCHNDFLPPSAMLMDVRRGKFSYTASNAEGWESECPHGQPGDRLYVRESWRSTKELDPHSGGRIEVMCLDAGYSIPWAPIRYEADGERRNWQHTGTPPHGGPPEPGRYRHARFMPRWASRILLEITGVRVERLNDCSEADAAAEGVEPYAIYGGKPASWKGAADMAAARPTAREAYRDLWDSINGAGAWDANPWVWIVEFRRV